VARGRNRARYVQLLKSRITNWLEEKPIDDGSRSRCLRYIWNASADTKYLGYCGKVEVDTSFGTTN
jgi:hypothetical protein